MSKKEKESSPKQLVMLEGNKDFSFRSQYIREAQEVGLDWFTLDMFVYHELRFMEDNGPSKEGFSFTGYSWYVEKLLGVTEKSILDSFTRLQKKGLVVHVCCDKRIFRNKTKLWISVVKLSGAKSMRDALDAVKKMQSVVDTIRVAGRGGNLNIKMLSKDPTNGRFVVVDNPDNKQSSSKNEQSSSENEYSSSGNEQCSFGNELSVEPSPLEPIEVERESYVPIKCPLSSKEESSPTSRGEVCDFEKEFEEVWKLYPNKKGKAVALKAYVKARKSGVDRETIVKGIEAYKAEISLKQTPTKFVKHGSTWFNQQGWEDEYENGANNFRAPQNDGWADGF